MLASFLRFQKYVWGSLCAVLILAGVLSGTTGAFNPQPDPPGFGMIGIVEGQTARLNIVNTSVVTDPLVPPDPCRARLQFLDGDGNVLAGRRVEVPAGRATFLDFVPRFAPGVTGDVLVPARGEIRASYNFGGINAIPPDPCRLTLEIFDNATGRTEIAMAGPLCRGARCRAGQ